MSQTPPRAERVRNLAAVATRDELVRELKLVREGAGLSLRRIKTKTGIAVSTLGDYFKGEHLPRDSSALVAILNACGVSDQEELDQWCAALARVRAVPGPRPSGAPVPYRGLKSYGREDSEWFFGREELTAILLRCVAGQVAAGRPLIMVVGPSGSGKSSLLAAGLVARVSRGDLNVVGSASWPVMQFTPGEHPIREWASRLSGLLGASAESVAADLRSDPRGCLELALRAALSNRRSPGEAGTPFHAHGEDDTQDDPTESARFLIVVDQFEEALVACKDDEERNSFVEALCAVATASDGNLGGVRPIAVVVLGLRADLYAHALRFPDLMRVAQDAQILVPPMTEVEMRAAIEMPARKANLELEDGLVSLLIQDLRPTIRAENSTYGHEAGALPLMSHALHATWSSSRGTRMTLADYVRCGGVIGAIEATAKEVFAPLSDAQKALARRMFLRLVHFTDDAVTRRRACRTDLLPLDPALAWEMEALITEFAEARLISLGDGTIEIAHDAVLSAWSRLSGWIESDRAWLRAEQDLANAATAWERDQRDPSALYRGGRLAAVRETIETEGRELTASSREFYEASLRLDRRRARRVGQIAAGFATVAVIALAAGALAIQQRGVATQERDLALSRMRERTGCGGRIPRSPPN